MDCDLGSVRLSRDVRFHFFSRNHFFFYIQEIGFYPGTLNYPEFPVILDMKIQPITSY
jgi:hypothetical protein